MRVLGPVFNVTDVAHAACRAHADFFLVPLHLELLVVEHGGAQGGPDAVEATPAAAVPPSEVLAFRAHAWWLAGVDATAGKEIVDVIIVLGDKQAAEWCRRPSPGQSLSTCSRTDGGDTAAAEVVRSVARELAAHGRTFHVVSLAGMGTMALVRLFTRSRVVVGLSGAGLSGAIFMRPGGRVFALGDPPPKRANPWFPRAVAAALELEYAACESPSALATRLRDVLPPSSRSSGGGNAPASVQWTTDGNRLAPAAGFSYHAMTDEWTRHPPDL